eukprot:Opistho-2@91484
MRRVCVSIRLPNIINANALVRRALCGVFFLALFADATKPRLHPLVKWRIRNECALAVISLLQDGPASADVTRLVDALVGRLRDVSDEVSASATQVRACMLNPSPCHSLSTVF